MNMKIGYDAKRLYNNFTGLGNYSRTLIHNLLTYAPQLSPFLYTPKIRESAEAAFFRDHAATRTRTPHHGSSALWRSYTIKNQLIKDGIQLFHGLSNEIPFSLSKKTLPAVVTIHDLIFRIYPRTYRSFDRQMYNLKFGYSCRNAQKVIAISESTRQDIIQHYKIPDHQVQVLYQACLPLFYHDPLPTDKELLKSTYGIPRDYLLYVGSVIERKNLMTIIRALDLLPDHLQLPLVVVGNGKEYKREVQQEIARRGLSHLVIWVGNLFNNHHLQQVYHSARMMIYPSVYEGFGLPVVEAMLSGTPVITSKVSSLPEAGGPAAWYLANPLDEGEMAGAISKILVDQDLAARMILEGRSYARKTFDPESLTSQLVNLYQDLI